MDLEDLKIRAFECVNKDLGRAQQFDPDREVVLAAVQQDWEALRSATESCRGDREIVLAAVKQDGQALRFATE
eukprot:3997940-Amphidinium_carterae.1